MGRFMLAGLFCLVALYCYGQNTTDTESSFRPTVNVTADEQMRFRNLADIAGLLPAFEEGQSKIGFYKPPILTRGSRGVALFRQAAPGVVLVVVGKVQNNKFEPSGLGTGAVIDSRGYMITNWHVIEGFSRALVFFKPADGAEPSYGSALVAEVVDYSSVKDLALLRLLAPPPNLTTLNVSNSLKPDVAEDVHIIGHPHGNYWSYSTGVVSQLRPDYMWTYADGSRHKSNVLQMQTAINPGNSGGPVLNDLGQIVGLVAMSEEGQNLNYAVSADEIRAFLTLHLPARTRGSQPTILARKAETLNYMERVGQSAERTLRITSDERQITTVTSGHEWKATVEERGNGRYTIIPSANPNVWQVELPNGRKLEVAFERGWVAEIREARR